MSDIEIEIDGEKLSASPNAMVIQVADEAGIYIPRFCYHKHLSVAANCRMCLVEVEKSPKALPACATPVTAGMKVFTRSSKALSAQKAVMEFLLINHPLDCPICDQGGECELQDLAMGYGAGASYFHEGKRAVKDKNIGPLIATDMTRCIQCTRCVRFGAEIAGQRELGATGRGEQMEIGTYIDHAMESEISGNVIDICPVGALTSKPFRFQARAWELDQRPTIAPHDCTGANLNAHVRYGKVMRMVPRENTEINEIWISDRDRFSYVGLEDHHRLEKPLIKRHNQWQAVDWETALDFTVTGLKQVLGVKGTLGSLISPNATLEECYLLQKWSRGLGSSHIDHRLRQVDFRDQAQLSSFPRLPITLTELEQSDVILLIGSNIQKEQPSIALRLRKAFLRGAKIRVLNMVDYAFHFDVADKHIVAPQDMVSALEQFSQTDSMKVLQAAKKSSILLGHGALNHPEAAFIRKLAQQLALACGASLGLLTEGANAAGAWLAGAIPHRTVGGEPVTAGLDAQAMFHDACQAYCLVNVEPEYDCANPHLAIKALKQAQFVISLSSYKNPLLEEYAQVILPIAPFTETAGTFINVTGEWQSFKGVAAPFADSRPAWKVLRVLGNLFDLPGFDYQSAEEIHAEVKNATRHLTPAAGIYTTATEMKYVRKPDSALNRIGDIPLYAIDSLVRRSEPLQAAQSILEGEVAAARMSPSLAETLHLKAGDRVTLKQTSGFVQLPVALDPRLPQRAIFVAGGIEATRGLNELYGPIEIHPNPTREQ